MQFGKQKVLHNLYPNSALDTFTIVPMLIHIFAVTKSMQTNQMEKPYVTSYDTRGLS